MLTTYKALLRGNQLEWVDDVPASVADAEAIPVHITLLASDGLDLSTKPRGQQMADALEQLALVSDGAEMDDPLAWQREAREDRILPGRGE